MSVEQPQQPQFEPVTIPSGDGEITLTPTSAEQAAALRDVAVAVPDTDEFSATALAAQIKEAGGACLESVRFFDLYVNPERLGPGRKSLAFELIFRAPDRTLTDEELEAAMAAVHQRLEALGGEIRKQ